MDAVRMVPDVRDPGQISSTEADAHYVEKLKSEDGVFSHWRIYAPGAPSTQYGDAPNGSIYNDITNYKLYIKTAASTWTVVGAQTA